MGLDSERAVKPANRALRLFAAIFALLGLVVGQQYNAQASAPTATYAPGLDKTWSPTRHPHEVEDKYEYVYTPAPHVVVPPSAHVENDAHWRSPNVRANTDATTFAQQEPAIAINPNNHLNIVTANKDERSAPGPG